MARKPKTPTPTPEPQVETAVPVPVVAAEPTANALVVEKVINLKKATREYAAELCDLCPPSSHAALLSKLDHVRANAELAIRG